MKKQLLFLSTLLILFTPLLTAQSVKIDSVLFTSGNSLSSTLNTKGYQISALHLPDAMEGSLITFQDSYDGIDYSNLIGDDGAEISLTIIPSATIPDRKIIVTPTKVYGCSNEVKLRTGTYSSPTNQSSSVWIIVELTKMIGN